MNNLVFERARTFMYRNARPLDIARFQYHFEDGSKEAVMQALSYYQNEDGGFGHALEADYWNPGSTPLHSRAAGSIISEMDYEDAGHPVIQRLLNWYTERESSSHADYNGAEQVADFLVRYGKEGSEAYQLGVRIANEAVGAFVSSEYPANKEIAEYECENIVDTQLSDGSWDIPKGWKNIPDEWIISKNWWERECEFIVDTQLSDESWDIPRGWEDSPDEWAISRNWWKCQVIIENLLYLKGFGKL